jgi:5'-deoxynucleotidase YfbR-like HD superfamily hydrolase
MSPQVKNSISTYNGDFFDFDHPESFDFDVETIAHALSNICRYGGHSSKFYSVAEHSVLVSRVVPSHLAMCGLFHDASEAFVGDMPSPLKAMCPDYRAIEERVHKEIATQFGLPYPFPPDIKYADKAVYKAERLQITSVDDTIWHIDIPPADVMVTGMDPKNAKQFFLSRYRELSKQLELPLVA